MERKERTITYCHLRTGDSMKSRYVVALSGPRACGKSSIAKILQEEYGFERFAFSDCLREIAALSGPNFVNDRIYLALLGDLLRGYDEDFIVNSMIKKLDSTEKRVVIEDVRFPKEAQLCLERGVLMVSLEVEETEQIRRIMKRDMCENTVAAELVQHQDNFRLEDNIEWDMIVQSEGLFSDIAQNIVTHLQSQTSK